MAHIGYFMSEDQAAAKFGGRRPRRSAEDGDGQGIFSTFHVFFVAQELMQI